jgi:hypothetical protein
VLSQLGFQGSASKSTFYEYIKSLRKLGTPFARGKIRSRRRVLATYRYIHLMELALALTLRVYHVVPDPILEEIIRHRKKLYRLYNRAYLERGSGIGSPLCIEAARAGPIYMRGAYLNLRINFSGGRLTGFGPPTLMSPSDALVIFANHDVAARAFLPINLSTLAERIVAAALRSPAIRTGPRGNKGRGSQSAPKGG